MTLGDSMINLKNHPTLAWVVDYWPAVVLMPTILLMIAVLVLVTRWWDRRDESVRARQKVVLRQQPAGYLITRLHYS